MLNNKNLNVKNAIILFLIFAILTGIYFRVAGTFDEMLMFDEAIYMVGALKMTHGSFEDPRLWAYEHPPLGKWVYGLPTLFIPSNYSELFNLPMNKYIWIYKTHETFADTYWALRIVPLLFGILSLFLIFLITRGLWGTYPAFWATAIAALFNHLIVFSKFAFLDGAWVFFTLLMLFLYIRYTNTENERNKFKYLILFLISLIFAFGSKNPYSVPTFAFLFVSNFFVEKNKKFKKIFFISLILITILFFALIYPIAWLKTDKVIKFASAKFASHSLIVDNVQGFFDFSFLTKKADVALSLVFAANTAFILLVFIFALFLSLYFLRNLNGGRKVSLNPLFYYKWGKGFSFENKNLFIVSSFFVVHFLFNLATNMGGFYLQVPILLLLMLSCSVFAKFPKSSFHLLLCVVLVLDIVFVSMAFPFSYSDANPLLLNKVNQTTYDNYNQISFSREALLFLENQNAPVLSNSLNVLVFFKEEKYAMPAPRDETCNEEFFEYLKGKKAFLVYKGNPSEPTEWFCPLITDYVESAPVQYYTEHNFWGEYALWGFK